MDFLEEFLNNSDGNDIEIQEVLNLKLFEKPYATIAVIKLIEDGCFKKLSKNFIHFEFGIKNIETDEFLKFQH